MPAPKEREKAREQKVNMKEEEGYYWARGSRRTREYIKGKSPLGVILANTFLLNQP